MSLGVNRLRLPGTPGRRGRRRGALAVGARGAAQRLLERRPAVEAQPTTAAPTTPAPASTAPATTSPGATRRPPRRPRRRRAAGRRHLGLRQAGGVPARTSSSSGRRRPGTSSSGARCSPIRPSRSTGTGPTRTSAGPRRSASTPMMRIRVGSCWATGGDKIDAGRGGLGYSVSAPPVDDAAYQDFVRSVVERYQAEGVDTYAIENEVNGEGFWRGSAADYEALVRSGAEAIQVGRPGRHASPTPGLSSTVWGVVMAKAAARRRPVDEAIALYDAVLRAPLRPPGAGLPPGRRRRPAPRGAGDRAVHAQPASSPTPRSAWPTTA